MTAALRSGLPGVLRLHDREPDPVRIRELSGGASRRTYLIELGDGERLVLRTGSMPEPNATMSLEAAAITAAGSAGVPTAEVVAADDGADLLGVPFLLTTWVGGEGLPRRILRGGDADRRRRLLTDCARALARVHAAAGADLAGLDRRDPWQRWRAVHDDLGEPSAVFEVAFAWLAANRPPAAELTMVHGDFRMGNLLVDGGRLRAVLDWELTHAGDPLEDLGWFCVRSWRFGSALEAGGLGTVDELVSDYEAAGGRPVDRDALFWWQLMGTLRWGVLIRFQADRHLSGREPSLELALLGRRAAEIEWDLLALLRRAGWPA